jgi:hypothetical protein
MAQFLSSSASRKKVILSAWARVERIAAFLGGALASSDDEVFADLTKIIYEAIMLDLGLNQQMAWWFVEYPKAKASAPFCIDFDSEWMEVPLDLPPTDQVAMMITPALIKAGDSGGENYDKQVCFQKSFVCGAPEEASSRPSGSESSPKRDKPRPDMGDQRMVSGQSHSPNGRKQIYKKRSSCTIM